MGLDGGCKKWHLRGLPAGSHNRRIIVTLVARSPKRDFKWWQFDRASIIMVESTDLEAFLNKLNKKFRANQR